MMNNWKTSLGGLLTAIGLALKDQPGYVGVVAHFLSVLGAAWMGVTAADAKPVK